MTGVRTSAGAIECGAVVVAAGAWSPALAPDGSGPAGAARSRARSSSCACAAAMPEPLDARSCARRAATSSRAATGAWCWAPRWRSRASTPTVTADGVYRLLEAAWEVVPGGRRARAGRGAARGCGRARPTTPPIVGPGELDGLVWATGHWRNGVLLAPLTGEAVAELLAGGDAARRAGAARAGALREDGARVRKVFVNGEYRELADDATVETVVRELGVDRRAARRWPSTAR